MARTMMVQGANVYRLDPTPDQAATFSQWARACRTVYNVALEQRRTWGREHCLSCNQQQAEITPLLPQVDWLKAVPVHALQMAVRAVDHAYQRFFCGFLRGSAAAQEVQDDSFTLPDPACLGFKRLNRKRGAAKVAKVGWVKALGWRPLGGKLRSITISRKAGHWYVSVAWRKAIPDPWPTNLPSVGMDRGVKVFAALSDRTHSKPLNAFGKIRDTLAKAQGKLSRKVRFSANWVKQKAKITRLHHEAANARKGFLHDISTEIAKNHGLVKVEKLQITVGARNIHQASALAVEPPKRTLRRVGKRKQLREAA